MLVIDKNTASGIKRVAGKVASDLEALSGGEIAVVETTSVEEISSAVKNSVYPIIMGEVSDGLITGMDDIRDLTAQIKGKREVFAFALTGEGDAQGLVIVGSDRLGTIYGMFELSGLSGVSPLKYWADAPVLKKTRAELGIEFPFISKEPSVKYRGFFVNDEWPCFGNWTTEHFNGFTAEMYDHVFELLLRLKGNYLWPAMWSSCFAWDGPGLASYELADEYGIYMGNSHHEPCLRAGEEWTVVNRKDPSYGGAWSVLSNKDGVSRFWKESMEERGRFNSLVTVGMRGERDSTILGENATLADNINVVKTAITVQKEILAEQEKKLGKTFPKMLALYKEVEPFYFGDETTEGLSEWDGLDDVILMLCEDNHNYTRILSDPALSRHKGGLGMYYHVDYHGGPVSYEWINSTPLSVIWEQMTAAYEFGVRDLWILNVGDLKLNEFPLTYFLSLAYDFEKWGSDAPNSTRRYSLEFLEEFFGGILNERQLRIAEKVLTDTVRLNGYVRPEALKPQSYNVLNGEADDILEQAETLEEEAGELYGELAAIDKAVAEGYYSLIYFPALAVMNHIKLNIFAGRNDLLAFQNRKRTNYYADLVEGCIERNSALNKDFANFKNHKWRGMEMASHIGFVKWNDDGCRYPVIKRIQPVDRPRLQVMHYGEAGVYDKVYGKPMRIVMDEFLYPGNPSSGAKKESSLTIVNPGKGEIGFRISFCDMNGKGLTSADFNWLRVTPVSGKVEDEQEICIICDHSRLGCTDRISEALLKIEGEDATVVECLVRARPRYEITAEAGSDSSDAIIWPTPAPKAISDRISGSRYVGSARKLHFEDRNGIDIPASGYSHAYAPNDADLMFLSDYGRFDSAVKAFPVNRIFAEGSGPVTAYDVYIQDEADYVLQLVFAPTNPPVRGSLLKYGLGINDDLCGYFNMVGEDYRGGENSCPEWSKNTVQHFRIRTHELHLAKGVSTIALEFIDPGVVLERIRLVKA